MAKRSKLLIIQTSGIQTPERVPAPFFIAATATAMAMDATIVFTVNGASIVEKQAAERVSVQEGKSTLKSFLDETVSAGVKLMVCHQSLDLNDLASDNLIEEVEEIVGAAALLDMTRNADHVLTF
jgi:predicted peroxiredoxin